MTDRASRQDVIDAVGYHNYARVGVAEAARAVSDLCPTGWYGHWSWDRTERIHPDAIRVGQGRVRSGDPLYMLFAVPTGPFTAEERAQWPCVGDFDRQDDVETAPCRTGRPPIDGETRANTFRWRLTPAEREQLDTMAAEHGETPSQYLRRVVFGPELQYSAWYDSGLGAKRIGTARDLEQAEDMAKHALAPDLDWVSWVIDHGTEHAPGKGEVARFSSHADAPGYNRVVRED